jgi:hypothetical protein
MSVNNETRMSLIRYWTVVALPSLTLRAVCTVGAYTEPPSSSTSVRVACT